MIIFRAPLSVAPGRRPSSANIHVSSTLVCDSAGGTVTLQGPGAIVIEARFSYFFPRLFMERIASVPSSSPPFPNSEIRNLSLVGGSKFQSLEFPLIRRLSLFQLWNLYKVLRSIGTALPYYEYECRRLGDIVHTCDSVGSVDAQGALQ